MAQPSKTLDNLSLVPFLWCIANDVLYYDKALELYRDKNVVFFPTTEEIMKILNTQEPTIFVSSFEPPIELREFFVIHKLKNTQGVLTSQQMNAGMKEEVILQEALGVSVTSNPNLGMKNIAGAEILKEWVSNLLVAEEKGYRSKGIFLIGIPGTGKTFFAQCLSGELKRPLVQLNLALLAEKGNPIEKLNSIFEYLNEQGQKVIILVDEVEKMIGKGDDPLTGRLMTILSDLGESVSEYKNLNAILFATANDIDTILKNQPAFLRRGRFDELFFVNLPTMEVAKNLFDMYLSKYKITNTVIRAIDLETLTYTIEKIHASSRVENERFVYTHSEIASFCKKLYFLTLANVEITEEIIKRNIELFIPLTRTSKEGIQAIIGQKELFIEI